MEHTKSFVRAIQMIDTSTSCVSRNFRVLVSLFLGAIISVGCSGGGGGGGGAGGGNIAPVTAATCQTTETATNLMGDLNNFVTDPDSMMFSYSRTVDGTKGTVTINTDGTFMYIPNMGERGFDTFTYEVDDLNGGVSTGTVQVLIGRTRIIPVGDSYTLGFSPPIPLNETVGYRQKLYDDLTTNNSFVDFVGGLSDGLGAVPPIADPDHHGPAGGRDDQILNGATYNIGGMMVTLPSLVGQLNVTPADIMLLHIGTNNINDNAAANNGTDPLGAQEVEMILNAIDIWETTNNPLTVFVAQIIERGNAMAPFFPNPNVAAFNNNIAMLVASRPTDNIVLVDINSAIAANATNYDADNIHLTQTGYDLMADTWRTAIEMSGVLPVCVP